MNKVTKFIKSHVFSLILTGIHVLLTLVLLGLILYMNILPLRFFIPVCFVLLVLCAVAFLMAYSKKKKNIGKIMSLILIIISSVGLYFVVIANNTYEDVTGADTKKDIINMYVMKSSGAEDLTSAKDFTFGIMSVLDRENTNRLIAEAEKKLGSKLKIKEYEGYDQLVDALYDGEVEAIILNSAYTSGFFQDEKYFAFDSLTRILMQTTHESQITVDNNINVDNQAFVMYLSGIDIEGETSTTSRSDVNLMAIINPNTRQVLLINTPRDYWVPLSISNGVADKLTHAGNYGIDVSMDTLEMLYDVNIGYYFRINFTGFREVIDALGGIDVYSAYEFTSLHGNDHFVKGMNHMNGKEALGFVRERYSFKDGDYQRGRNQMEVIKAIADKAVSPAFLNNFTSLMNSIRDSFETSMSSAQISSIVRTQLAEGGSWEILTYTVAGRGAMMPVYSMSSNVSVQVPIYESVDVAKELIDRVTNDEKLTQSMIDDMKVED